LTPAAFGGSPFEGGEKALLGRRRRQGV